MLPAVFHWSDRGSGLPSWAYWRHAEVLFLITPSGLTAFNCGGVSRAWNIPKVYQCWVL